MVCNPDNSTLKPRVATKHVSREILTDTTFLVDQYQSDQQALRVTTLNPERPLSYPSVSLTSQTFAIGTVHLEKSGQDNSSVVLCYLGAVLLQSFTVSCGVLSCC